MIHTVCSILYRLQNSKFTSVNFVIFGVNVVGLDEFTKSFGKIFFWSHCERPPAFAIFTTFPQEPRWKTYQISFYFMMGLEMHLNDYMKFYEVDRWRTVQRALIQVKLTARLLNFEPLPWMKVISLYSGSSDHFFAIFFLYRLHIPHSGV